MSTAYVRPSGGLLSEMCNITQVLQHFLKGHIEAILTIGSHHDELAVFHFFQNVEFCDTSAAKSMILLMYTDHKDLSCAFFPIIWPRNSKFLRCDFLAPAGVGPSGGVGGV